MTKINHQHGRHRGKSIERLRIDEPVAGPWTHVRREPVRRLTRDEIAAFLAERPDLKTEPRARARDGGDVEGEKGLPPHKDQPS